MAAMSSILLAGAAVAAGAVAANAMKPKTPNAAKEVLDLKEPAAEQASTDVKATQNTNLALAAKNKARRASSLLASGDPAQSAGSALGYGKSTLGQ